MKKLVVIFGIIIFIMFLCFIQSSSANNTTGTSSDGFDYLDVKILKSDLT